MTQSQTPIAQGALILGIAGLLPQVAACIVAFSNVSAGAYALLSAFTYSALIFSFIGGVWWGQALVAPLRHTWIFVAAVAPSLITLGATLLLFINLRWWPFSIGAVATGLLLSPLVDLQIGKVLPHPDGWIKLRWTLSIGLGCLTLLIATITLHAI
jgi:Protein of unknown function (DUF3429)